MFELSNEQRTAFALIPVNEKWTRIEPKPNPYDDFKTILYLDRKTIVKCFLSGETLYCEYELGEKISEDGKYLLPKTAKGKPVLLSAATI